MYGGYVCSRRWWSVGDKRPIDQRWRYHRGFIIGRHGDRLSNDQTPHASRGEPSLMERKQPDPTAQVLAASSWMDEHNISLFLFFSFS